MLITDIKTTVYYQTNNDRIVTDNTKKNIDFTNLKIKKRTTIQRIKDTKKTFALLRKGLFTIILTLLLYCLIYFNNLDYVRNNKDRGLYKYLEVAGTTSLMKDNLFDNNGSGSLSGVSDKSTKELLMESNTLANKDNFVLWVWNFWYFLAQRNCLFLLDIYFSLINIFSLISEGTLKAQT